MKGCDRWNLTRLERFTKEHQEIVDKFKLKKSLEEALDALRVCLDKGDLTEEDLVLLNKLLENKSK